MDATLRAVLYGGHGSPRTWQHPNGPSEEYVSGLDAWRVTEQDGAARLYLMPEQALAHVKRCGIDPLQPAGRRPSGYSGSQPADPLQPAARTPAGHGPTRCPLAPYEGPAGTAGARQRTANNVKEKD